MKKGGKLKDWRVKKLTDLFKLRPPKKEARDLLSDSDLVSFLPMEDLGVFQRDVIAVKEKTLKEVSASYTYFANNDVLLAKITPCFENGKAGIVRNLKNGIGFGSSEYIVFRSKGNVIPEFLFYFFALDKFRKEGKKAMTGAAGQKRVSPKFIESLDFAYPPLPEQQRIVLVLDNAFASIAQAKSKAERNLVNARELFDSFLKEVFAKKNEGWNEQRFEDICVLQRGFDLPTKSRKKGDYPLVTSNGITDRVNVWKVKAHGVVTGRSGTIGTVHFIEEDYWPLNTALYIKDFHGNYEKFVYYFLKQFNLKKYSSGAGVPTLNRNNVHGEKVYFPSSLAEQRVIVGQLEALQSETRRLESNYQHKIQALDELKKSLLAQAFSGEL